MAADEQLSPQTRRLEDLIMNIIIGALARAAGVESYPVVGNLRPDHAGCRVGNTEPLRSMLWARVRRVVSRVREASTAPGGNAESLARGALRRGARVSVGA